MKAKIKRNMTILLTAETLCEAYVLSNFYHNNWVLEMDCSIMNETPVPKKTWNSDDEAWDEDQEEWG